MLGSDFVLKGRTLVEQNQLHQAVEVCRTGLLAEPGEFEGRLILGAALMALGRYQEVVSEMTMALERVPNHPQALALQGEALMNLGDWGNAVRVLSFAVRAEPQNQFIHSLYNEARSHRERNAVDKVARTPGPWPAEPTVNLDYALISGDIRKIEERPVTQTAKTDPATELSAADLLQVDEPAPTRGTEVRAIEVSPANLASASVVRRAASVETQTKSPINVSTRDVLLTRDAPELEDPTSAFAGRAESVGFDVEIVSDPKISVSDDSATRARPGLPAHAAAAPPARAPSQQVVARVEDLFPDDERGVSRMIDLDANRHGPAPPIIEERPQRVVRISQPPNRAKPGSSSPPVGRTKPPSSSPPLARSKPSSSSPPAARKKTPSGGVVKRPAPNSQSQRSRAWRELATQARTSLSKVTRPATATSRGRFFIEVIGYLVLTAVVMAASVYGGILIRQWRFGDEIASARAIANQAAATDTLAGYLEVLDTEERILEVMNRPELRAAHARASAALAAEFGHEKKRASELVAQVHGSYADAVLARTYLAVALGDDKAALESSKRITVGGKSGWVAPYLIGRAALLNGDYARAEHELGRARKLSTRPVIELAMADVALLRGRSQSVLQALSVVLKITPRHPGALARQGILCGQGHVAEIDRSKLESTLAGFVSRADKKSPTEEAIGAAEIGWVSLGLAELLRVRGDIEGAVRALERAMKTGDMDDRNFATLLGVALLRSASLEGARRHAETVLQRWPNGAQSALLKAELSLMLGEFADIENLIGKDPTVWERAVRARARLLRGQWDEAESDLRTVLSQESFHRQAVETSALLALKRARPEVAIELIKPLYDKGERGDVAVLLAEAMGVRGDGEQARTTLSEAFTSGSSALAAYVQAHALRVDGQVALAQKAYADCIRRDPGFIPARWELTLLKRDDGDRRAAQKELDELARSATHDGAVLLAAAEIASFYGEHERARGYLDRAGTLKDASSTAWHVQRERGRILLREGDIAGAVRALERARSLQPNDRDTNLLLIQVYGLAGTLPATDKIVTDMASAYPQSSAAAMALGLARLVAGKTRDAQVALARAETLAQNEKAPAVWRAEIDFWQGRAFENDNPARAAAYYDRALERCPDHAGAHYHRGNLYFDSSDNARAAASYQSAITNDPIGYPKAYFFLGTVLADLKQPAEAKKALQTFVQRMPNDVDVEEAKALLQTL